MKFSFGIKYKTTFRFKLLMSYWLIILIPLMSALFIFGNHLFNQTKASYEQILNQFGERANVAVDDFFSNVIRNSFFYITNSSLTKIIEHPNPRNEIQFLDDSTVMRKAMDQIVLMNGSIAGVTLFAFNGAVYSSTAADHSNMKQLLDVMPKDEIYRGKAVVSPPYTGNNQYNRQVSIIRYLNDLGAAEERPGYVKLDINFRTIENMLGGISDSNADIGTFIATDRQLIHLASEKILSEEDIESVLHKLDLEVINGKAFMETEIAGQRYWLAASKLKSTDWTMVYYMPEHTVKSAFQKSIWSYSTAIAITLGLSFLLAVVFSNYFFKPINRVRRAMKLVDAGSLQQVVEAGDRKDELGELIRSYNAMIERLALGQEKERRAGRLQRKAELHMLQSQINPHFLYNTLNIIHSIAELHRISEISTVAKGLSSLYRYNVKSKDMVAVRDELEQVKHYIAIQQIRFIDKVSVLLDIEDEVLSYRIVKFLVQPLVENAFYHGLEKKEGKGKITIAIRKSNQVIVIRISDDGAGIEADRLLEIREWLDDPGRLEESGSEHYGLWNVNMRIKYVYGEQYGLSLSSALDAGTTVEICIPAELERNDNEHHHRG